MIVAGVQMPVWDEPAVSSRRGQEDQIRLGNRKYRHRLGAALNCLRTSR